MVTLKVNIVEDNIINVLTPFYVSNYIGYNWSI